MKQSQRLDYSRLAEVLHERGMADLEAIRELLHQPGSFPEALVSTNLVADWDLSRVVCEIFSLPFLPVELVDPDPDAREGLDSSFLIEHGIVPLGKFGQVLTVCMPGMVPAEVLGMLAAQTDMVLLPVVGTVQSNRRWLDENLGKYSAPEKAKASMDGGWGSMFDDADAAVLMDLGQAPAEELEEADALEFEEADDLGEESLEFDAADELEAESLQFEVSADDEDDTDAPSLIDFDEPKSAGTSSGSNASVDLPPVPDFDG